MMLEEEYEQLQVDRAMMREVFKDRHTRGGASQDDSAVYLPVNIDRLVENARRKFRISQQQSSNLHPKTVVETVRKMCEEDFMENGRAGVRERVWKYG